jgi:hypothetical protein
MRARDQSEGCEPGVKWVQSIVIANSCHERGGWAYRRHSFAHDASHWGGRAKITRLHRFGADIVTYIRFIDLINTGQLYPERMGDEGFRLHDNKQLPGGAFRVVQRCRAFLPRVAVFWEPRFCGRPRVRGRQSEDERRSSGGAAAVRSQCFGDQTYVYASRTRMV